MNVTLASDYRCILPTSYNKLRLTKIKKYIFLLLHFYEPHHYHTIIKRFLHSIFLEQRNFQHNVNILAVPNKKESTYIFFNNAYQG
jgi:hypothetical protein